MYFYGKTDIGKKRQTNQDNFLTMRICDNVTLFVLCDGMGGTNGGNIASQLAVRTFSDYIEKKISEKTDSETDICDIENVNFTAVLNEAVSAANSAVYARARENSELTNMGTTIVAALVANNTVHIANIGDSRLYKLASKTITQLTHDHSYVQMLVDMGQITKEEAQTNPRRNILTRALGTEGSVEADISTTELPTKGGYLLLCSDGLYNFLTEENIVKIIHKKSRTYDSDDYDAELAYKAEKLIDTANRNGGGDNITIILIKIV